MMRAPVALGEVIEKAIAAGWSLFGWYEGARLGASRIFDHFVVAPNLEVSVFLRHQPSGGVARIASYPLETVLFGENLSLLSYLFPDDAYERIATDLVVAPDRDRVARLHRLVFPWG